MQIFHLFKGLLYSIQGRPWPICCPRQDFTWCPMHYSPFHPIICVSDYL